MASTEDALANARRRALRAARVVTISLALATGGCGDDATGTDAGSIADAGARRDADVARDGGGSDAGGSPDGGSIDGGSTDAGAPRPDAGRPGSDAGLADAGGGDCVPRAFAPGCMDYDCACPPDSDPSYDPDCCAEFGGFPECFEGMVACAVPGPFVPPSMPA
jgi:hypothetical protein